MALSIATWNVNSVRLRIDHVRRILDELSPDVLCLQETKSPDDLFPRAALEAAGYGHMLVHGMKGYNGVAVISRVPLKKTSSQSWCGRTDCRHGIVELPGGIELHNLYVPAGGDVPDPVANPKFAHKLQFLDELTAWFSAERTAKKKMVIVGDLNIAPLETDVWSHKQLLDVVSHTPIEVEKLGRLQQSAGFVDAMRHFVPPEEKLFTWWSYRNQDWEASDRGRRLDHVWVTPPLVKSLKSMQVHRPVRGWEKSSDHVPVMVTLG